MDVIPTRHIDAHQLVDNRNTQTDAHEFDQRLLFADNRITAVDPRQAACFVGVRQAAVVGQRQPASVLDQRTQVMTCVMNLGVDVCQHDISMTQTQSLQLNIAIRVNNSGIDVSGLRRRIVQLQQLSQYNLTLNIYPNGGYGGSGGGGGGCGGCGGGGGG